jgi:hypothetical protein
MPNWVEQNLHVVGSKTDVDAFINAGFLRRNKERFDNLLDLHRLCPLKRREPKTTYTHDSAVVLVHFRTRTQAFFSMITRWDYPAEFYARLAEHWPTLAFACSVNEEMAAFRVRYGGPMLLRRVDGVWKERTGQGSASGKAGREAGSSATRPAGFPADRS